MNSREWAVYLAEWGWYVFPIPPDHKEAWKGWPEASCADPYEVGAYWPDLDANIGVHCGPSGLLVLDIDVVGTYDEAMDELGVSSVPDTFTVQTASGKWHLYFAVPLENDYTNRAKIPDSKGHKTRVDVRANNGYVLGPGSRIGDGEYTIVYDDPVAPLAESPRLVKWVKSKPRKVRPVTKSIWGRNQRSNEHAKQGILRTILEAEDGELNTKLYWAACRAGEMIVLEQWDYDEAEAALTQAATEANLESHRIGPTINSGLQRGMSEQS